ncbi:hypothetical protein E1A91_D09G175300v1 [Gossypium mustelinum]|uniref:Uncharacterized protein n=1 Tax=Gossypium mustelinum TaxID=34275 RepID=A0A5D2TKD3_GOSMU|nr:hypothetical protein E1A91_D09G175300v1 [Gossypium mustelinum]
MGAATPIPPPPDTSISSLSLSLSLSCAESIPVFQFRRFCCQNFSAQGIGSFRRILQNIIRHTVDLILQQLKILFSCWGFISNFHNSRKRGTSIDGDRYL